MKPFSFVLLIILIFGLIRNRNFKEKYMFLFISTCIAELYMVQGNFLVVEIFNFTVEIDYLVFLYILLFLSSLVVIVVNKIEKKGLYLVILFILSVLAGVILELLAPLQILIFPSNYTWDYHYAYGTGLQYPEITLRSAFWSIKIFSYVLAVVVSKSLFSIEDLKKMCTKIVSVGLLMVPIGVFELLTKQRGLNIVDDFTTFFFGSGYNNQIIIRAGNVALKGFTPEPGIYANALGKLEILMMVETFFNKKRNKFWFFAIGVLLLISMTFTGLYFIIIIFAIYFIIRRERKTKKSSLIGGVFLGSLAIFLLVYGMVKLFPDAYLSNRLVGTFNQLSYIIKGNVGDYVQSHGWPTSEMIRLSSIRDTLLWFLKRPFFGLGLGTTQCLSGVASTLVNIGIVGFFFWWKINLYQNDSYKKQKNRGNIILSIVLVTVMQLLIGDIGMLSSISTYIIMMLLLQNGAKRWENESNSNLEIKC